MQDEEPSVAKRILQARERAGIAADALAESVGLEPMAYYDLEHYDDEAFTTVSLAQLCAVARAVRLSPRLLLAPEFISSTGTTISMQDVVQGIRRRIAADHLTPAAFSDAAGWDVSAALEDPESAWAGWCVDTLRDVCEQVGIDWRAVVPEL